MVVGGAFLVTRREASKLLATVDQALDAVAKPVERPIEGAGAAFVLLARNGDPHPMLTCILANLPAAVTFIADHPLGAALGTAWATALDRSGRHELGKNGRLVPLSWGEHKSHEPAIAFRSEVHFGTEAAPAAAEGFGLWVPFFAPAAC